MRFRSISGRILIITNNNPFVRKYDLMRSVDSALCFRSSTCIECIVLYYLLYVYVLLPVCFLLGKNYVFFFFFSIQILCWEKTMFFFFSLLIFLLGKHYVLVFSQ